MALLHVSSTVSENLTLDFEPKIGKMRIPNSTRKTPFSSFTKKHITTFLFLFIADK